MEVKVREEHGIQMALYGLSLSFKDRAIPFDDWLTKERFNNLYYGLAGKMFKKDGGHNKFLESLVVWIDLEAPRGFWQEFDTYRVGTTKQSESTMHTIQYRPVTMEDFEEGTDSIMVDRYNEILKEVTNGFESKKILRDEELEIAKNNLPEGYLQRRVVCLNYKVLRNMFMQRHTHRLKYWKFFISEVIKQVKHPQFLEIK